MKTASPNKPDLQSKSKGGAGTVTDLATFQKRVESGEIKKKDAEHYIPGLDVNHLRMAVQKKQTSNVILYGNGDNFNIFANVMTKDSEGSVVPVKHVLTTKLRVNRNITNPQTAFKLLSDLGVKRYRVLIKNWNPEAFFNKHKLSVDSRERALLKKAALEHRYIFLDKFCGPSSGNDDISIYQEKAEIITLRAIKEGYVRERSIINGHTLANWIEDRNPTAWAVKAAADLCLELGIFPSKKQELEMAAFASIWFDTRGPFTDLQLAIDSLPKDKKFPSKEMGIYLKTEVNHHKHVMMEKARYKEESKSKKKKA